MRACTQRTIEGYGSAVGFQIKRYRLCICNINTAKFGKGDEFAPDTIDRDPTAVGVEIIRGSLCLIQFYAPEFILHMDVFLHSQFGKGDTAAVRIYRERVSRAVFDADIAEFGAGAEFACRANFIKFDRATVRVESNILAIGLFESNGTELRRQIDILTARSNGCSCHSATI